MKFVDEPTLKMLRDGDWMLTSPLTYISSGYYIVAVPTGFITDLASIPRILQSLIPQHGDHSLRQSSMTICTPHKVPRARQPTRFSSTHWKTAA
jgi:hypothetical protein